MPKGDNQTRRNVKCKDLILSRIEVDEITSCWNWTKGTAGNGYPHIRIDGERPTVIRVVWELWRGQIPDLDKPPYTMCVCHKCDNIKCCNPEHLF